MDSWCRYSLFPPATCFDACVWWRFVAWVLPAAGWCWKAGSPSAGIQVKAPPLGSFSSSGRKEVKITEKVTVLHKSESVLFYGFLSKGKKKGSKRKKILDFQVESQLSWSGWISASLCGKNLHNRSRCLRTLCPAPLSSVTLSTTPGWAASPSRAEASHRSFTENLHAPEKPLSCPECKNWKFLK